MRVEDLRHRVYPAVPVPHGADGQIDRPAHTRYVAWLADRPIGGVAVWTQTGRGLRLSRDARDLILNDWRDGLRPGQFLIATAGSTTTERHPDRVIASARLMAQDAADGGADAILVQPPTPFRSRPELDRLAIEYQSAIGSVGLPLILSYQAEAGGGVPYRPHVLAQLLARDEVIGILVGPVDSVMLYQDVVALVREHAPLLPILTGENRFLGYSLIAGADGALDGLASAFPELTSDLVAAHRSGDLSALLRLTRTIDDLARHTYLAPMEGATQRLLWSLVHRGVIPLESAFDPWAPRIGRLEFDQIGVYLNRLESS